MISKALCLSFHLHSFSSLVHCGFARCWPANKKYPVRPEHATRRSCQQFHRTPSGSWAVSFSDGRNDLPTAIRAPPPPRVAHSTPLGLLYLGTHALFCRAAGSVVAPGFAVPPRPSGACSEGVCTRLGGFPVPRRKAHGRGASARQPEKSPASWLAAFASSGWQRRLSSAAEVAPALLSLLLGRFSL